MVNRPQPSRVDRITSKGIRLPCVRVIKTVLAAASLMEGVSMSGFFSAGCCAPAWTAPHVITRKTPRNASLNMVRISASESLTLCGILALGKERPPYDFLGRLASSASVRNPASQIRINFHMADRLYLSIWFPGFQEPEMLPRLLSVLKQFPFSADRSGVGYLAIRSISWDEPIIFQQTFDYRVPPENALALAADFLHEDNAYEVDVAWDLWVPEQEGDLDETWDLWVPAHHDDADEVPVWRPQRVKFRAFGTGCQDATYQQSGHIQVDV